MPPVTPVPPRVGASAVQQLYWQEHSAAYYALYTIFLYGHGSTTTVRVVQQCTSKYPCWCGLTVFGVDSCPLSNVSNNGNEEMMPRTDKTTDKCPLHLYISREVSVVTTTTAAADTTNMCSLLSLFFFWCLIFFHGSIGHAPWWGEKSTGTDDSNACIISFVLCFYDNTIVAPSTSSASKWNNFIQNVASLMAHAP